MKGVAAKLSDNFSVLEKLLDIDKSPAAANDTLFFRTDDLVIKIEEHKEPAMTGGFKMANSASDALVLQYYEAPTEKAAAFGHDFSMDEWEKVARIKDWYGDVLFSAPIVATNVAHPLLETMLSEIRTPGRKFSFLCGHDSNICSVLAALESEDYSLQEIADIEKTSRSAVYDVIRRCRRDLLDYESKLHLHMSYVKRRKLYEEIRKQAPETGSLLDQCIDTETD